MPRSKHTAEAQLDQLRQQAGDERIKQREAEAALVAATAEVEQASRAVADAYALGNPHAIAQARKTEDEALTEVSELRHRVDGASLRVENAQTQLDGFLRQRARDLLAEREQPARTIAAELTASVDETLRLAKAYVAERQAVDRLVAAVAGATPRADGPAPEHPWEAALKMLERCYQQTPALDPPLPRWRGLEHRAAEDNSARRLQLQRRKKLTVDEQAELDRLDRERTTPAEVMQS